MECLSVYNKPNRPKREAGAWVGVGTLRGGGDSLKKKIKKFVGFLVPWFLSVLASKFLGFLAS